MSWSRLSRSGVIPWPCLLALVISVCLNGDALADLVTAAVPKAQETTKSLYELSSSSKRELKSIQREREFERIAASFYHSRQFQLASDAAYQLAAMRKQRLGEHHPTYAVSLDNLGEIYRAQGNYREAALAFDA